MHDLSPLAVDTLVERGAKAAGSAAALGEKCDIVFLSLSTPPIVRAAVEELAHGLLALGVRKGDAFAILGQTSLEWALFDFALAHVGAIGAAIYANSAAKDCEYILDHSEAVGVLAPGKPDALFVQHVNHVPLARRLADKAEVAWGGQSSIRAAIAALDARNARANRVGVIGPMTFEQHAMLAARFGNVALVAAGTTLGMMLANGPAVLIGEAAAGRLPLKAIRIAAAAAFAAIGLWILVAG